MNSATRGRRLRARDSGLSHSPISITPASMIRTRKNLLLSAPGDAEVGQGGGCQIVASMRGLRRKRRACPQPWPTALRSAPLGFVAEAIERVAHSKYFFALSATEGLAASASATLRARSYESGRRLLQGTGRPDEMGVMISRRACAEIAQRTMPPSKVGALAASATASPAARREAGPLARGSAAFSRLIAGCRRHEDAQRGACIASRHSERRSIG